MLSFIIFFVQIASEWSETSRNENRILSTNRLRGNHSFYIFYVLSKPRIVGTRLGRLIATWQPLRNSLARY